MKMLTRKQFLKGMAATTAMGALGIGAEVSSITALAESDVTVPDGKTITTDQVANLKIVLPQASFDLGPFGSGRVTAMVQYMLYQTLMTCPVPGTALEDMLPRMAKSCTMTEDGVYEIELYENIYDSQGNPITASDIVFSLEYGQSIGSFTCLTSYLDSAVAEDDTHLTINVKNEVMGAIEQLLDYPHIISQTWFEAATEEERSNNPATTGPYYVDSVVSGSSFVLKANEDFWQAEEDRIYVDNQNVATMEFTVISEMAMVAVALENGEVDLAEIDGTISEYFVNDDGTAMDGYSLITYMVNKFNCLEFNCSEDSPLNNQNLRLAIAYALDNEQLMLAADVALGMGTPCHDYGNAAGAGYNSAWDDEDYYDRDLDKAKEYFAASGYEEGLQLHLLFAISTAQNLSVAIQAELAEIGIDVIIDAVEQATYESMETDSTQWDMRTRLSSMTDYLTSGWAARFDEDVWGEDGTANWVHDDELQDLLHEAMQTQTAEAIDAFHYYLMEKCYSIGLYTANKCYIGQGDILSVGGIYQCNPVFNDCDFTTDYVSCIDA
ncbi:MAG: ABC transporter substrate-binding protein [Clostridiales bacterium]|nr:ABC transporter substrate-binding protein [Clostridiales bacterium]